MKQYFKFKIKDEYLPDFITELKNDGKLVDNELFNSSDILSIDNKYLRLLKIKNLENNISEKDKEFLEFLLDDRNTVFLTKDQCDFLKKITGNNTSTNTTSKSKSYNIYSNNGVRYNNDYYITINDDMWS